MTGRRMKILDYFRLLKRKDCLGASYIFIGENILLVKDILRLVICREDELFCGRCRDCRAILDESHPDLFIVKPESTTITIESIRAAQRFLFLKGFRAKRKVLLIKGGESLGLEAANAFLKTLEEPPKGSFIAVSSSKLEGVLPTVISRCQKVFLPYFYKKDELRSTHLQEFFKGERIKFKDRDDFATFLRTLIDIFHRHLLRRIGTVSESSITNGDEVFLEGCSAAGLEGILGSLLKVYRVHKNINENLAVNLIRAHL